LFCSPTYAVFFHFYLTSRHLHSFPTRRSSDLRLVDAEYQQDEGELHRRHQMLWNILFPDQQTEQYLSAEAEYGCHSEADEKFKYIRTAEIIPDNLEYIE